MGDNNINKYQVIENIIGGNYTFNILNASDDSSIEDLILTSIKVRIICEGICNFIIRSKGIHMKHVHTMRDFISTISNISQSDAELKNIITDLQVVQIKCNSFAHFQVDTIADYRDIQVLLTSFNKICDWFIEHYNDDYYEESNIASEFAGLDDLSLMKSPYDVKADISETESAAESGSVKAMYEIANMYFYGIAFDAENPGRNVKKASYWFKRLASVDSKDTDYDDNYKAYGMRYLGHMYYSGVIPSEKQSYEKCFHLHLDAAKLSTKAMPHLAYMYLMGSGCKADIKMAIELYEEVIKNGDSNHIYYLANLYQINGDFKRAGELYKKICDKYPAAAFELGTLYEKGLISDNGPNYFMATIYMDISIRAGYKESEAYLEKGKMFFNPTGEFTLDFEEAENCFLKSAALGNTEACYMLGYMYQNGHVKAASIDSAIFYHKKAAAHWNSSSALALAILYQQKGNYEKAFEYAKMSYNMGSGEGSFVYGNMLMIGIGCSPDLYAAKEAYEYALEKGCEQADFMLERLKRCQSDMF